MAFKWRLDAIYGGELTQAHQVSWKHAPAHHWYLWRWETRKIKDLFFLTSPSPTKSKRNGLLNVIRVRVCPSTSVMSYRVTPTNLITLDRIIIRQPVRLVSFSWFFILFYNLPSCILRVLVFVNRDVFTTGKKWCSKVWFINLDKADVVGRPWKKICARQMMMMIIITCKMSKTVRHSFAIRAGWDWVKGEKKKDFLVDPMLGRLARERNINLMKMGGRRVPVSFSSWCVAQLCHRSCDSNTPLRPDSK